MKRTYGYLGERKISIDAPEKIMSRIERNIEESPAREEDTCGEVKVREGAYVEINRRDDLPYLWKKETVEKNKKRVDYMRYDSHVQTIWRNNLRKYEVLTKRGRDWNGALNCFKKIYYDTEPGQRKALVQSALINVNGKGTLIVGGYRKGKSTLLMNFLEKIGGKLVTGGNTLIERQEKELSGFYLPRSIYLRFSSIASSPYLSPTLKDIRSCESTQPLDYEAIENIINTKSFNVDAGLTYSRKKFSELTGIETIPFSKIERIIFTEYGQKYIKENLSKEEGISRIRSQERPKNPSIGSIKKQQEISPPENSKIKHNWADNVEFILVSHDEKSKLNKKFLEKLL